jgi:ribosomal protein S18 acetylase RimI-like enzyme
MEILSAKNSDIREIMDLIDLCVMDLQSQDIYQWNSNYPRQKHIEESIQNKSMFILKDNDICLGIISITKKQPLEYDNIDWLNSGMSIVISKLAIHPEWQKKGLGKELMDFAEKIAKNYDSIRLDAYSDNETAINFYKKRGFVQVGKIYFPKRDRPFYAFEKLLNQD